MPLVLRGTMTRRASLVKIVSFPSAERSAQPSRRSRFMTPRAVRRHHQADTVAGHHPRRSCLRYKPAVVPQTEYRLDLRDDQTSGAPRTHNGNFSWHHKHHKVTLFQRRGPIQLMGRKTDVIYITMI
jgi:hypothetical protein